MKTNSFGGVSAPAVCALSAVLMFAGQARSQVDTRDWLTLESGAWSDASRWSDGDVPNTLMEQARLSPSSSREFGATPTVSVDGHFEVHRVLGNGTVDVLIPAGNSLKTALGLLGVDGHLRVLVGDDSTSGAVAELEFTLGRTSIRNSTVALGGADSNSVLRSFEHAVVIDEDSMVVGQGRIEGQISNGGLVESRDDGFGDVLTLDCEFINNHGVVRAGSGSTIEFVDAEIIHPSDGEIVTSGTVHFRNSIVNDGIFRNEGRAGGVVTGDCAFDGLVLDAGLSIDGYLELRGGELVNNAFNTMTSKGLLAIDEDTTLTGTGGFDMWRTEPQRRVAGGSDVVLTNDSEHTLSVRGTFETGLTNLGELNIRGNGAESYTLRIIGPFVQESTGVLDLTILNHDNSRTGDMVIVDRNNAELGGKALVRVNGNGDWDLNTFTILRVLSNGQGQAVSGQFETIELRRSGPAMRISPIPEMIYLDDRVDVALYCKADVNRNGSIEPTDFAAWIGAYQNNSDLADVNEDGNLTQADFSSWINYYSMPCGN